MKFLRTSRPLFFAIMTFAFYIAFYHPPLDFNSREFITACMSFFAVMGWSSMIVFTSDHQSSLLSIYGGISVIGPIAMYVFCKGFDRLHVVAFVLFLIAFIGLRFFVSAHVYYQNQSQQKKNLSN